MNENTILFEKRNVYGNELIYCIDERAAALRQLTGKKTLTMSDLAALEKLGFECLFFLNTVPVFQNYID